MEELEVLESIYLDDLNVESADSGFPISIQLQLHPATGDELDKRYVCMTLTLRLSKKYPDEAPEIVITNPRGIAEEEVQSLQQELERLAEERVGGEMLYELIDLAKESLTEGNVPYCPCTICCEHFTDEDLFTKTDCYHYFHNDCLRRYIEHQMNVLQAEKESQVQHAQTNEEDDKIKCPVCREEISYDLDFLQGGPCDKMKNELSYCPSDEIKVWQNQMTKLYLKQKEKGGIIDVEAEKNRYLLTDSDNDIPIIIGSTSTENVEDKSEKSKSDKDTAKTKTSGPFHFNQPGRGRGQSNRNQYSDRRFNERYYQDTRRPRSDQDNFRSYYAGRNRNDRHDYDKRPLSGQSDRRGFSRGGNSKSPRNNFRSKVESKVKDDDKDKSTKKIDSNNQEEKRSEEKVVSENRNSTETDKGTSDGKTNLTSSDGDMETPPKDEKRLEKKMASCDIDNSEKFNDEKASNQLPNESNIVHKNQEISKLDHNRRQKGRGQRRHAGHDSSIEVKGHGHFSDSRNHGYYRNKESHYYGNRKNRHYDDYDYHYDSRQHYPHRGRCQDRRNRDEGYHDRQGQGLNVKKEEKNVMHKVSSVKNETCDKQTNDKRADGQNRTDLDKQDSSLEKEVRKTSGKKEEGGKNSLTSDKTDTKSHHICSEVHRSDKSKSPQQKMSFNKTSGSCSSGNETSRTNSNGHVSKHSTVEKSEKTSIPPGFKMHRRPPGFSEKSVTPPPGF